MMSLALPIVDQRVQRIAKDHAAALGAEPTRARSRAFVVLCVATVLDLRIEEALDALTDGPQDGGIDALWFEARGQDDVEVVIFQAKYHEKPGLKGFPSNELKKLIETIGILFHPDVPFEAEDNLRLRVEEVRSLVAGGRIPTVRVIACSNGRAWEADGDQLIDPTRTGFSADEVTWEHLGAEDLLALMQDSKAVDADLRLAGQAWLEEDFPFRRALVGRMAVAEVARLMKSSGPRLLDRNIRRYLGARNRVNAEIRQTLVEPARRKDFFFYNNGLTFVCEQFRTSGLVQRDQVVKARGLRLVNGGQTASTIQRVVDASPQDSFEGTWVLVRVYEVSEDDQDVVSGITLATNSQSPVDLRDLRANDDVQRQLEIGLRDLGYNYVRKRGLASGKNDIHPEEVAEAMLCTWCERPDLARTRRHDFFGGLYELAFGKLLTPQRAVDAVWMWRAARPTKAGRPETNSFRRFSWHWLCWFAWRKLWGPRGEAVVTLSAENEHLERSVIRAVEAVAVALALRIPGLTNPVALIGPDAQRASDLLRRADLVSTLRDLEAELSTELDRLRAGLNGGSKTKRADTRRFHLLRELARDLYPQLDWTLPGEDPLA